MVSILKVLSIFSGSRGPDGPDLPSPSGRKFQFSVQFSQSKTLMVGICGFRLTVFFYELRVKILSVGEKKFLVARGLPRDTENIPVYWKNFTSGLFLQSAFSVSISGQH